MKYELTKSLFYSFIILFEEPTGTKQSLNSVFFSSKKKKKLRVLFFHTHSLVSYFVGHSLCFVSSFYSFLHRS